MTQRITLGLAVALLLVVLIPVARHERTSWAAKENRGIETVRLAVGARLTNPEAFRDSPHFTCLVYPYRSQSLGLELCFAPSGAIVEAIHRTPGLDPKIWTLRADPSVATVRENPLLIARILDRLGVQTGKTIQVGGLDEGPEVPPHP